MRPSHARATDDVAARFAQMAPVLRRLYDQMPDPKWSSPWATALLRGVFNNLPSCRRGRGRAVDVYVAGCPPAPKR